MTNKLPDVKNEIEETIEEHGPGYLYRDEEGNLHFVYDSDQD